MSLYGAEAFGVTQGLEFKMLRYLRLYAYCVRFSVMRSLEFRVDFFFRVVMDCLFYLVNFAFYGLLFSATESVGGWSRSEAFVFVAGFCVVDALQMTLFSNNIWMLPLMINRGDLDYHLVRPVNSLFFVSLRDFAVNSFLNLIVAVGLLVWALSAVWAEINIFYLFAFLLMLLNGTFLHFSLHFLTVVPVFWTQSPRGFEEFYWAFSRAMERPDRVFRGWAWRILVSIAPYGLMASFPARVVLDEGGFLDKAKIIGWQVGVSMFFLLVISWVWKRGLKAYASASS